jgi:hypothetical protein
MKTEDYESRGLKRPRSLSDDTDSSEHTKTSETSFESMTLAQLRAKLTAK